MPTLSCSGVEWELADEADEVLRREVLEQVHALDRAPHAERLKDKKHRTVYRVALSDGRLVVVKVFLVRSLRERLKARFLRDKAAAEWRVSRRLAALGVPASRALAVGRVPSRRGAVASYLLIAAQPGMLGVNHLIKHLRAPEPAARAAMHLELSRDVAAFVRRVHDAGVRHGDLHAGNLLARPERGAPRRFILIDLLRVRIGRAPSPSRRAKALAKLLSSFASDTVPATSFRQAFVRAYLEAGPPLASRRFTEERVLALARREAARKLASRLRHGLRSRSRIAVDTLDGWRIHHVRDYPAAEILASWVRHEAGQPPAAARAPGEPRRATLEVKAFPRRRGPARWLGWLVPSRAARAYAGAYRRWLENHAAPRPVAVLECLRGEARGTSALVLELPVPDGGGGPRERR